MPKIKTTDATRIRNINRAAILDLIRSQEPISRTRIADRLNISLSTVLRIVEELMAEGLVVAHEDKERGGGRPGEMLVFNGSAHSIIGIDLGYPNMLGTVANLAGDIYCQYPSPIIFHDGPENIIRLLTLIEKLLNVPETYGKSLKGIAIGVSGRVNPVEKSVIHSPDLGWQDLHLAEIISNRFHLPVLLDTDINLITLGEYGFGAGRDVGSLLCLTLGSRVLSGVILDGEIWRGFNNSTGLLGHSLSDIQSLRDPSNGLGALESIISGPAVTEKARTILSAAGLLAKYPILDAEIIYQAAQEGDVWALPILEELTDYLAMTVANISLLLDPEMIVIAGKMSLAAGFLPELVKKKLQGKIPRLPNLATSPLGTRSTVMGAIMMIYKGILNSQAA